MFKQPPVTIILFFVTSFLAVLKARSDEVLKNGMQIVFLVKAVSLGYQVKQLKTAGHIGPIIRESLGRFFLEQTLSKTWKVILVALKNFSNCF